MISKRAATQARTPAHPPPSALASRRCPLPHHRWTRGRAAAAESGGAKQAVGAIGALLPARTHSSSLEAARRAQRRIPTLATAFAAPEPHNSRQQRSRSPSRRLRNGEAKGAGQGFITAVPPCPPPAAAASWFCPATACCCGQPGRRAAPRGPSSCACRWCSRGAGTSTRPLAQVRRRTAGARPPAHPLPRSRLQRPPPAPLANPPPPPHPAPPRPQSTSGRC